MTDVRDPHFSEDQLYDYALGERDPATGPALRAHLNICAQCSGVVTQAQFALSAFAFALPLESPGSELRKRVVNAVAAAAPAAAGAQPRMVPRSPHSIAEERPSRWNWMWAFGAASAFAAILLAVSLHLNQRVQGLESQLASAAASSAQAQAESAVNAANASDSQRKEAAASGAAHAANVKAGAALGTAEAANAKSSAIQALLAALNAPDTAHYVLTVAKKHPQPQIRALYRASTGQVLLTASALPALQPGKTYELWWMGGTAPKPAGLFQPDSSGSIELLAENIAPNLPVKGFAVTVEAASGSQTPTLPIVLVSN